MSGARPAIFIDRDGTISDEIGYVNHAARFRVYPWSVDAIRLINRSGRLAVMITNQAGVARGYFPRGRSRTAGTASAASRSRASSSARPRSWASTSAPPG